MIVVQDILVSDDVLEKQFMCNLDACKGACCWEGDFGAPLEDEELSILKKIYKDIKPYLDPKGLEVLKKEGLYTFYEDNLKEVVHIDFTAPYSESLRQQLINTAKENNIDHYAGGTYAVTQGPRLETAAEINRYEKDGCDIVGMTSMPEASLARELEMEYACCSLVVNWAAGKTDEIITMEIIENNLKEGIGKVHELLSAFLKEK